MMNTKQQKEQDRYLAELMGPVVQLGYHTQPLTVTSSSTLLARVDPIIPVSSAKEGK